MRSLFRRHGVYEDDQDLVQQVAVRLITAETKIDSDDQLLAYGLRAARWVLADYWRGSLHRASLPLGEDFEQVASEEPSQESRLESRQILQQAMEAMSPRELEAFSAVVLEGLSEEEVAARMAISPSSVRSLLRHARKRAQTSL
jgi:RNA polymerase sigma factor (sigma-70 family)